MSTRCECVWVPVILSDQTEPVMLHERANPECRFPGHAEQARAQKAGTDG